MLATKDIEHVLKGINDKSNHLENLCNIVKGRKRTIIIISNCRLHDGLKQMGLELFVQNPDARLPTVTTIKVRFSMIK